MKFLRILIPLFCLLTACGGDDANETNTPGQTTTQSSCSWVQRSWEASSAAGEITIEVRSKGTMWTIVKGAGDMISNVTPLIGGDTSNQSVSTVVTVNYLENTSEEAREQQLILKNDKSGEESVFTLKQKGIDIGIVVQANMADKRQHVVGFGGMYNPIIWTGNNLISAKEMETLYAPDKLGYNVLRLMIYPNKSNWKDDVAGVKLAQQYGAVIFACPWDCTDALADQVKVNGKSHKHLRHDKYADYAQHLIDYINYMKQQGVNLTAISVQNEPDMDFTYWTPDEIANFIAEYGAQIRATGVKLMGPEACGFQPEYTNAVLNKASAFAQTDIIVGHLYQGFLDTSSSYVRDRHDYVAGLYKKLSSSGKSWWMTEHLFNDGEKPTDANFKEYATWSYQFNHLGREMHECMATGCSAYIYWYLKRFYGMMGDNDSERSAVAMGTPTKNGYLMAHYARYAAGKTLVQSTSADNGVLVTAYLSDNGKELCFVMLNTKSRNEPVTIELEQPLTAASAIVTDADRNMQSQELTCSAGSSRVQLLMASRSIVSLKISF